MGLIEAVAVGASTGTTFGSTGSLFVEVLDVATADGAGWDAAETSAVTGAAETTTMVGGAAGTALLAGGVDTVLSGADHRPATKITAAATTTAAT